MEWKIAFAGISLVLLLCTFILVFNEKEIEQKQIQPPTDIQREFYHDILPAKEKTKNVIYEEIFQVPSEWRIFPEHEGVLKPYLQGKE